MGIFSYFHFMKPMETKRQKQVARELQRVMGEVFSENTVGLFGGAFVSITDVMVTKDLLISKFFLSVLQEDKRDDVMEIVLTNKAALRQRLAEKIKNSFRRVPEVEFYLDETLDDVFKMDKLFKGLQNDESKEEE